MMVAETDSKSSPSPNNKIPAPAETGKKAKPLSTSKVLAELDSHAGNPTDIRTPTNTINKLTKPTIFAAVGIPSQVHTTNANSRKPTTMAAVAIMASQNLLLPNLSVIFIPLI